MVFKRISQAFSVTLKDFTTRMHIDGCRAFLKELEGGQDTGLQAAER